MTAYLNGLVPGSAVYLISFLCASLSVAIQKYNEKRGLLQENGLFEEFASMAPYPIVQYTKDGYPTIWNLEMEKETGYLHAEIIAHYNETKKAVPQEEWKYIVMRFLYKGKNLEKVEEYIQILKTGKGYANVAFTMDTKCGEEKTFLWSAISNKSGGDTRTARHLLDTREIQQELEKTKRILRLDPLTEALSLRAFNEDIVNIITQHQRSEDTKKVCMFFIDLDNFK